MPAKLFKRINLDTIYPPFRARMFDVIAACQKRGAIYFCTYGLRTFAESDALYAQGRTAPGVIVTHARGGDSAHNFGIAQDFTHDSDSNADNGLQPDWKGENYTILREEVERAGLVSGASFHSCPDMPHAQLPGYVSGTDLAPLKALYLSTPGDDLAKLSAVWAYLDSHSALT